MDKTNLYAAPNADLSLGKDTEGDRSKLFYVVSPLKFFVLFFTSFGLYQIYWFYRNWKLYKTRTGESIWPIPRAIFAIFFTHSLFEKVDLELQHSKMQFEWDARTTATIFVVLQIASNLLDRLVERGIGGYQIMLLWLVSIPMLCIPIYKAQRAINIACDQAQGESNSRFSIANFFWIAIGLIFGVSLFMSMLRVVGK